MAGNSDNSLLFMDMDFTVAVSSECCKRFWGDRPRKVSSGSGVTGVSAHSGRVNGGHESPCI